MAGELIDLEAVLADLEKRRETFNAAIDAAKASIQQIISMSAGISSTATAFQPTVRQADPKDWVGLSLTDAAKRYLRQTHKKQTNKEIADGLEAAGFIHTSKNFANTIGTALWRADEAGDNEIYRDGRYWLLTEWLPGGRKPRRTFTEIPSPDEIDVVGDVEDRAEGKNEPPGQ